MTSVEHGRRGHMDGRFKLSPGKGLLAVKPEKGSSYMGEVEMRVVYRAYD